MFAGQVLASQVFTGIPYTPFPVIQLGPVRLMTFGLFVAIGVIAGIYVAARRNERFGIPRSQTEKVGLILVALGFVGARVLWVVTHPEEIKSFVDVFAGWNGGLQFSGGLVQGDARPLIGVDFQPRDRKATRQPCKNGGQNHHGGGVTRGKARQPRKAIGPQLAPRRLVQLWPPAPMGLIPLHIAP